MTAYIPAAAVCMQLGCLFGGPAATVLVCVLCRLSGRLAAAACSVAMRHTQEAFQTGNAVRVHLYAAPKHSTVSVICFVVGSLKSRHHHLAAEPTRWQLQPTSVATHAQRVGLSRTAARQLTLPLT